MLATHEAQNLKIQFEIEIEAPPDKVWAKLATLEGMNEWFSRTLVFEHEVGGRFSMEGVMDGPYKFAGEVVRIEPEKELAFTWRSELGEDGVWDAYTLVSFQLEPSANGTRVSLTHSGFEVLGAESGKAAYEGHIQGWTASAPLDSLKEAVEAQS